LNFVIFLNCNLYTYRMYGIDLLAIQDYERLTSHHNDT